MPSLWLWCNNLGQRQDFIRVYQLWKQITGTAEGVNKMESNMGILSIIFIIFFSTIPLQVGFFYFAWREEHPKFAYKIMNYLFGSYYSKE